MTLSGYTLPNFGESGGQGPDSLHRDLSWIAAAGPRRQEPPTLWHTACKRLGR